MFTVIISLFLTDNLVWDVDWYHQTSYDNYIVINLEESQALFNIIYTYNRRERQANLYFEDALILLPYVLCGHHSWN